MKEILRFAETRHPAATCAMNNQKYQVEKLSFSVFIAGLVAIFTGFGVWAATGKPQPAVRIIATSFWLVFAISNFEIYCTGRIRWRNGPTFFRKKSPVMFHVSAITFTIGSMGISTVLLWAAYFGE